MNENQYAVVCNSCDADFVINFLDEDNEIRYCPFCGIELIEELDFNK